MPVRWTASRIVGPLCTFVVLVAPLVAASQRAERPPGLDRAYERLRAPQFVPAAQAHFLKNDDIVLGVSVDGVTKAYPAPATAWHHVVFDQLRSGPILVTW